MTSSPTELTALQAAALTIWRECGERPPTGEDLTRAASALRGALASGRQIPRLLDKTIQPMSGPRSDIEALETPT